MKNEEKYLEEEMVKFGERWPYPTSFDGYDKDWVDELAEECAKHFYELGKKAMKGQMIKEMFAEQGTTEEEYLDKSMAQVREMYKKLGITMAKEDKK